MKAFILTVSGIVLCLASVRADAPSDETIKQVVTGNEVVLASGEHDDFPLTKDERITAIVRGDEMVSRGIGGTPIGTTLYSVKVTVKMSLLGEQTLLFYFFQDSFHEWKAIKIHNRIPTP